VVVLYHNLIFLNVASAHGTCWNSATLFSKLNPLIHALFVEVVLLVTGKLRNLTGLIELYLTDDAVFFLGKSDALHDVRFKSSIKHFESTSLSHRTHEVLLLSTVVYSILLHSPELLLPPHLCERSLVLALLGKGAGVLELDVVDDKALVLVANDAVGERVS